MMAIRRDFDLGRMLWKSSFKSDMRGGCPTQAVGFVQLKRCHRAMTVDKTGCPAYIDSGLLECMHFPVLFISQSILPE